MTGERATPQGLAGLGTAVTAMLALAAATTCLHGGTVLARRSAYHHLVADPSQDALDRASTIEHLSDLATLLLALVLVGTAALFIAWLFRARRNVARAGVTARLGPGWAVGAWFVPVAGLWLPEMVAHSTWRGSEAVQAGEGYVRDRTHPWLLLLWWYGVVLAYMSRVVAGRLGVLGADGYPTLPLLMRRTTAEAVSDVLLVIAAGLAILVVRRVTRLQAGAGAAVAVAVADQMGVL